jgi:hypothetical protein
MKNARSVIIVVTVIVAITVASTPALSQGIKKARELRDNIIATEAGTKDADEGRPVSNRVMMTIEDASSYVIGMCDAWNSDHPGFVPTHVGWLKIMGVIRQYIDSHPERLQDPAADVARQAILEAYHKEKTANH